MKKYSLDEDGLMFRVEELRELVKNLANRLYDYSAKAAYVSIQANLDINFAVAAHEITCEDCHPPNHQYIFDPGKEVSEVPSPEPGEPTKSEDFIRGFGPSAYQNYVEFGKQPEEDKKKWENLPDLGTDLWKQIDKFDS